MNKKRIIYLTGIIIAWTILLASLLIIEFSKLEEETRENARIEAKANFNKDQAIRFWAASHGGVYVPIDSLTQPNPALIDIVDRDIETPSGVKLTLMNPAYMVRELNEYFADLYGIKGHITSHKLMRDKNEPDVWEAKALDQFEKGITEVSEFTEMNNEKYLRLMQPLFIEESCLKCHGDQGYKIGDVRGGIGVAVPMKPLLAQEAIHKERTELVYLLIWLIGSICIVIGYKRLVLSLRKQKQAENELSIQNRILIRAKEKAEESDRLKSAFLTNMSHEIRTPMNGILGFANLLKEPELSGDEQQEYIKVITDSGNRMLNTINDIIDISIIEAGHIDIITSDVNINSLLDQLYAFFNPEVEKKGIQLTCKKGLSDQESNIRIDNRKFNSILENLIKNAIKYSHSGIIEFGYLPAISTNTNEEGDKPKNLLFYVKDTGVGIPKDKLQVIFERFRRVNINDKMVYEGSGLGLSISKAYVELLGGKIDVKSEVGIGSRFTFTIPYEPIKVETVENKDSDSTIKQHPKIDKLKILIAEDDYSSGLFLTKVLKPFCKEILIARTGLQALEICKQNLDIDLILMDIRMPEMDGYKATNEIRKFNTNIIIIAQTAFGMIGDKTKALESGCNDYISKPINKNELYSLLDKHLKN